ncbi:MAG TPA: nicotinate phosphoribosyltransferase, partial [Thermoanaerobaculia bacterium]|nr:nicotinate phosphoribosyltransferase [Thermoanaerobaculia bacterium]
PLLTDLYQLTMAYGYWRSGLADRDAVFHLSFRKAPFGSGFTVAAGLEPAIEYLRGYAFTAEDIEYLRSLTGTDARALFSEEFLRYLQGLRLTCDVDAVPEGTVVFPHEPLVRVRGPILQAQLIETALLNIINFQSLVATKAARVVLASGGRTVLEFGLRRAHGPDGGLSASRAAFLGGCAATSNVLAGQKFGIDVRGTHAHSWVMAFPDELTAFEAYAEAMPNNVLLLVDTYDTLEGVRNAIAVGRKLRARGSKLIGIRLDSGDLAWLSIEARRLLDEADFTEAKIVATNDLDEEVIASLIAQGARIDVWGVGTRLVTAFDHPALGGVYKLGAIRDEGGEWERRLKVSEQALKTSIPGVLQVRRFTGGSRAAGDMIYDTLDGEPAEPVIIDPGDPTRRKSLEDCSWHDLLVPVFRGGSLVYDIPPVAASREHALAELSAFHSGVKRIRNPHIYPAGLEKRLHERRTELIFQARGER